MKKTVEEALLALVKDGTFDKLRAQIQIARHGYHFEVSFG